MAHTETTRLKRLLETAAREFAALGFKGASLNRILARANVSKGIAYYHFKDKADLFAAVLRGHLEQVMAGLDLDPAQLGREDFWERALETFRHTARVTLQAPWMQGMMQAVATLPREARTRGGVGRLMDDYRARVDALLARGQALGLVRSDVRRELLLEMLLAMNHGLERWLSQDAKGADLDGHLESFAGMVRRVVEPPAVVDTNPGAATKPVKAAR